MPRYRVKHRYHARRDGKAFGPWEPKDDVELDQADAEWVNRDSPGTLSAVRAAASTPEPPQDPPEGPEKPPQKPGDGGQAAPPQEPPKPGDDGEQPPNSGDGTEQTGDAQASGDKGEQAATRRRGKATGK
ncbi:hypothetical protein L3Q67_00990 [Saccharothrix sp. AJ9571]|nr:hypothetical protein L3Q67_00990 [Saccharothrix sp. AJ9571]